MTHLKKLPKNVGDFGKLIVALGFEKMPKVQKIAKSGHTAGGPSLPIADMRPSFYSFSTVIGSI